MKKLVLFILLSSCLFSASAQESLHMVQTSNWDVDTLPGHNYGTFNDVWGYADNEGNEYAIMGSASYVHFLNVTDPANPVEIAAFPGGEQTVWRDIKTYSHYAYTVSDGTSEGIMIFDLSYLPDSVVKVNQTAAFFGNSHNIFIDETHGRLYAVGSGVPGASITVVDVASDPENPSLLATPALDPGGLHDFYVRDNILYGSHGWNNQYVIWDFTDPENPQYIASFESNGYNHSSWVTEDGKTAVFAEEVPTGLPMGLLDISDMGNDNLQLYTYFKFPLLAPDFEDSTPHNPYILGNDLVIASYYEDGVMVFDISDPSNPFLAAYYDTYPQNTQYNGYAGCWGVYPFLPSGNILASDMENGLSVLQLDYQVNTEDLPENIKKFQVFPNPASEMLNIRLESRTYAEVNISFHTIAGQLISNKQLQVDGLLHQELDISNLPSGMYFVKLSSGNRSVVQRIVKY